MIHPDKLTQSQREEIIKYFVTILAFHEGYSIEQELALAKDDPRVVRWNNTAISLLVAVMEAIS